MQQLQAVAAREGLALPEALAQRLAQASERNLRRALLSLEACRVQQYPFDEGQSPAAPDWELYIQVRGWCVAVGLCRQRHWKAAQATGCVSPVQEIAADVLAEQSPKRLLQARGKLYELLTNCVPPEVSPWAD